MVFRTLSNDTETRPIQEVGLRAFAPITFGRVGSQWTLGAIRLTETYHAGGTALPLHDHEDYTVNLVLQGVVEERVGRRTHLCHPGSLLAKPAGQHHANRYFGNQIRCVVVQLRGGATDPGWTPFLNLERGAFRKGDAAVRGVALSLCHALEERTLADADLAGLVAISNLLGLCAARPANAFPAQWLAEARDLLAEPGNAAVLLSDLSARLGVPLWMLSRSFQQAYGLSPSQYRRRARLERVARQLRDTNLPVSVLAHGAGFADHSHLVRWFRRAYGCTPTEYRTRTRRGARSHLGRPLQTEVTP